MHHEAKMVPTVQIDGSVAVEKKSVLHIQSCSTKPLTELLYLMCWVLSACSPIFEMVQSISYKPPKGQKALH